MQIKKRIRQLKRYRKIAIALVRNGFGFIVHDLDLLDLVPFLPRNEKQDVHKKSVGERIRLILEELGPTFVKLGQIASTRPDLLPTDVISALEQLQDQVPPFHSDEVVEIVEDELGERLQHLFLDFNVEPIASASIGQVHEATLHDSTKVAVKVQRPRIQEIIETDLGMLEEFAMLAEKRLVWAKDYRLAEIVQELARSLHAELDYSAEARNGEKFAKQCKHLEHVRVPTLYPKYCSRRILTMEYVTGVKLSDHAGLMEAGHDPTDVARRFASIILHQVLIEGFFHGDPHPGNVIVQENGDLILLDFGMVGRLTEAMKKHFALLVIALRNQSSRGVIRAIGKMGIVPTDVDESALRFDVDELRDKYIQVPLSQVRIGEAVNDLFRVARRHRIRIPSELTMLGKTLLTMEGVVTALDPDFSIFEIAEPYGRRLFKEQFDPIRIGRRWLDDIPEFFDLLTQMPASLRNILTQVQRGKVRIEVTAPELTEFLNKLDRVTDKLSFSIVLLAFSILMVGLIIGSSIGHKTSLSSYPVIEIGMSIAGLFVLWLVYEMIRSIRSKQR
ncbi:ABC1 kinase family protein [Paenibacillus guangzhouensis]|uniref:ABC1 kinase family protein n=1 Tax=Paenibacillus guangzhouensis TaxID=1473112 RepID=UPI001266BE72|nr:AarF/ABC1/UbiB kinase family protein [Paenibacillus guangzhouensis]